MPPQPDPAYPHWELTTFTPSPNWTAWLAPLDLNLQNPYSLPREPSLTTNNTCTSCTSSSTDSLIPCASTSKLPHPRAIDTITTLLSAEEAYWTTALVVLSKLKDGGADGKSWNTGGYLERVSRKMAWFERGRARMHADMRRDYAPEVLREWGEGAEREVGRLVGELEAMREGWQGAAEMAEEGLLEGEQVGEEELEALDVANAVDVAAAATPTPSETPNEAEGEPPASTDSAMAIEVTTTVTEVASVANDEKDVPRTTQLQGATTVTESTTATGADVTSVEEEPRTANTPPQEGTDDSGEWTDTDSDSNTKHTPKLDVTAMALALAMKRIKRRPHPLLVRRTSGSSSKAEADDGHVDDDSHNNGHNTIGSAPSLLHSLPACNVVPLPVPSCSSTEVDGDEADRNGDEDNNTDSTGPGTPPPAPTAGILITLAVDTDADSVVVSSNLDGLGDGLRLDFNTITAVPVKDAPAPTSAPMVRPSHLPPHDPQPPPPPPPPPGFEVYSNSPPPQSPPQQLAATLSSMRAECALVRFLATLMASVERQVGLVEACEREMARIIVAERYRGLETSGVGMVGWDLRREVE